MDKSGVNWYRVYYIFTAIHTIVGLVNDDDFRVWLTQFLIGTVILAVFMVVDSNISKKE